MSLYLSPCLHPATADCIRFRYLLASPWAPFHKAVTVIFLTFRSDLIAPFLKILQQCLTHPREKNRLQVAFIVSPSLPVHPPVYAIFSLDCSDPIRLWLSKPSKLLLHASKSVPFSRMHLSPGLLPVFKTTKYSIDSANFILIHVTLSLPMFSFLNQARSVEVWGVYFPHFTIPKQENLKGCPTGWDLIVKMTE